MRKNEDKQPLESFPKPPFQARLSPQMTKLLEGHFWCDFSDIIPALSWEDDKISN